MKNKIQALFDAPTFIDEVEDPVIKQKLNELRKLIHLEIMHFLVLSENVGDVEDYIARFGQIIDLVLSADLQTKNVDWFELKKNFQEISGQFETVTLDDEYN